MNLLHVLGDCAMVALGGACGALTRFGVQQLKWFEDNRYYYTVGINISGCFVMGVLWPLLHHLGMPRWVYLLLLTGFLGGYTTYSAFTLDAMERLQAGRFDEMVYYVLITVFGGLGACALGLFATERLLKML